MPARFLQLHTLTSYPAVLLNRDDAGLAKQIPFGSAVRTRISSQCLKRHWRTHPGPDSLASLGIDLSVRSRETFRLKIAEPLIAAGHPAAAVEAVIAELMRLTLGESALKAQKRAADSEDEGGDDDSADATGDKADDAKKKDPLHTGQVTVLGAPEVTYLKNLAERILPSVKDLKKVKEAVIAALGGKSAEKELKKNLQALALGAGLDAAVFGRMVTGDILARCDAAVHVAHAFTVHGVQAEADYFSAVDDLTQEAGETGAGHINSTDLTSGIFYGYVVIDVPLLVANLTGCDLRQNPGAWLTQDRNLASKVVATLATLIATVTPGAKLGSTAPHSFAHLMLAEAGDRQPCTLANAFLKPVSMEGDPLGNTYAALAQELIDLDWNFPSPPQRCHLARGDVARHARLTPDGSKALGGRKGLADLTAWLAQQVTG
jgi:CRISPR system Cascade subunit CasC